MKTETKFKFHLTYKVVGKVKECVSISESETLAKLDIEDLYGKDVEVEFLEVINTGEA